MTLQQVKQMAAQAAPAAVATAVATNTGRLSLLRKPVIKPFLLAVVGEPGVGKTTFAATFPKPVMICTEEGTASLIGQDVAIFPTANTSADVLEALDALLVEVHDYKTIILDSVTQLDTNIQAEIVSADPKAKSINTAMGGFGAGYTAASERHRQIREACQRLVDKKGMIVIFIAHADTETLDLPDQDPYSRYTIRIHKKSVSHYSDNVDAVAYLKLKTIVTGGDGAGGVKKAITTGDRVVSCCPTPSHISKNRFGITEDIPFILLGGECPLKNYIPFLRSTTGE